MYNDLSYFYQHLGNYKESFEYRKKSFELNKKINYTSGIIVCLLSFGDLFSEAGDMNPPMNIIKRLSTIFTRIHL